MTQIKWQLTFLTFLSFYQRNINAQNNQTERIINGFHASAKQFPYQVFIDIHMDFKWIPMCGGVIISNRIVLTAAHCMDYEIDAVTINFGTVDRDNLKETGQQNLVVKRENVWMHPQYDSTQKLNDIALINLPADLYFDEYIQPVQLSDPNQLYDQQSVVYSRWGKTSGSIEERLMYSNETVWSNEECKSAIHTYTPGKLFPSSWICLKPSESCTCSEDSGGPLVIRNEDGANILLGLTSFGTDEDCSVKRAVVFTRVSSYLEWIKQY